MKTYFVTLLLPYLLSAEVFKPARVTASLLCF